MIAEKLRELAEEAERATRRLTLPRERYTLAEALEAVRAACPGRTVNLQLSVWHFADGLGQTVEWSVYDGQRNYKCGTLTAAVAACLAANTPADTIDQAQEAIAECFGEPATAVLG
jgi:hypothetical protein